MSFRIATVIVSALVVFGLSIEAKAQPADWSDYEALYTLEEEPRGSGTYDTWNVVWQGQYNGGVNWLANGPWDGPYCVGIIWLATVAEVDGSSEPGPVFMYYATRKSVPDALDLDCDHFADDGFNGNSGGFRDYDPSSLRPGIIWLHGDGFRGSFLDAMMMAKITSTDDVPTIVFALSAPGQGYDCVEVDDPYTYEGVDGNRPECALAANPYFGPDQFSVGEGMGCPNDYIDGFPGIGNGAPDFGRSLFFDWGLALLRTNNFVEKVASSGNTEDGLYWTNGHWCVIGGSAGGVVALDINGVDDRPDCTVSWYSSGGQKEAFKSAPGIIRSEPIPLTPHFESSPGLGDGRMRFTRTIVASRIRP
ncbi:hypothetical protein K8I61_12575 [bacterium]|nr:hypothetical protein [bacterium]